MPNKMSPKLTSILRKSIIIKTGDTASQRIDNAVRNILAQLRAIKVVK